MMLLTSLNETVHIKCIPGCLTQEVQPPTLAIVMVAIILIIFVFCQIIGLLKKIVHIRE
jgi:hypothetical protein